MQMILWIVTISDVHEYKTRASCTGYHISGDDLVGTFSYFGKIEWNALPDRLKTLGNIDLFKIKLKEHLIEHYRLLLLFTGPKV